VSLAVNAHTPGPCRGRSAASKVWLSTPLSTPSATLCAGALPGGFAFVAVEPTDLVATGVGVVADAIGGAELVVTLRSVLTLLAVVTLRSVLTLLAVVTLRTVVVGVDAAAEIVVEAAEIVVEAAERAGEVGGAAVFEPSVRVKTSTSSSNGLDHITRCALLSDEIRRAMVNKTYRGCGPIAVHDGRFPSRD
jgi:hypothetical protein